MDMGKYLKFVIAALGAVVTVTQTVWPTSHWTTVISSTATALLVYLAPNGPKG
jgi:hypothetical protein